MPTVELNAPGHTPMLLSLRPLTGADEIALSGAGSSQAQALLARLVEDADLPTLTASQIDRLLARIYEMLYGPRAECRARCEFCGETYEFILDLTQIITEQDAERQDLPDADDVWTLPGGARVREPKPEDLTGDPKSLAARLTIEGETSADEVEAFLETAAPVLTLDLAARCPDCDKPAQLRFDLATYLTRRLAAERPFLVRETHLIASHYGWPHGEIMALPRDDRRAYAGLVEAERTRLNRRLA